jgi:hypothetical protein
MQLPNPPWYRRWSVILAGVIGLATITALLGLRGLQEAADPSPTSPTQATVVASTTTTPPTTSRRSLESTSTTRGDGTLWERDGKDLGAATSPGFRAPSTWHIEWSFDCSNFRRYGGGNFKITGNGAFERIQIQEFDVEASGTRTFTRGGYGHLLVDSVCKRWHVRVQAD